MAATDYLTQCMEVLGQAFPKSKWNITDRESVVAAVLQIDVLSLRMVMFRQGRGQFPAGAVSLTLHANDLLLRRYGTPAITGTGEQTKYSMDIHQFGDAAAEAQADLLGFAAAILMMTEAE
jgi:hypothetical protein